MKITPLKHRLTVYEGKTLNVSYLVTDEETGSLADMTGYIAHHQIRKGYADDGAEVVIDADSTSYEALVHESVSEVQVYVAPEVTVEITAPLNVSERWVHETVIDNGTERHLIAYGPVEVIPEVCRVTA